MEDAICIHCTAFTSDWNLGPVPSTHATLVTATWAKPEVTHNSTYISLLETVIEHKSCMGTGGPHAAVGQYPHHTIAIDNAQLIRLL